MNIDNSGNFVYASDEEARECAQSASDILEHCPALTSMSGHFRCPHASWQRMMDAGNLVTSDFAETLANAGGLSGRMYCLLNLAAHLLAAAAQHFKVTQPAASGEGVTPWAPPEF